MLVQYKRIKLDGNLVVFNYNTRQQIHRVMNDPFVEIDMENTDIIDSAGLELLTKLRHQINERKGHLKIVNVNPSVKDVLDVCGLTNLVDVHLCEKISCRKP